MDTRVAQLLPAEIRAELVEVEEAIGAEVGLRSLRAEDASLMRRGDVFAMESGMEGGVAYANLLVPPAGQLKGHVVAHEIMHAHRNLVQSVWRLVDASGEPKPLPTIIENDLEHLAIIPREVGFFPEAEAYWRAEWEACVSDQIGQLTSPDKFERLAGRGNALRLWLTFEKVMPDHPNRQQLLDSLVNAGNGRDAQNIIKAYERAQPSKSDVAAMALRFAGLPVPLFAAERYLPAERRIDRRTLPQ